MDIDTVGAVSSQPNGFIENGDLELVGVHDPSGRTI